MIEYFKKLFSSDAEASSKRFIAVVLVMVLISGFYLFMFVPVPQGNHELVLQALWYIFLLILVYGSFIYGEPLWEVMKSKLKILGTIGVKKAESRTPDVVVQNENVSNQNIPGNETTN